MKKWVIWIDILVFLIVFQMGCAKQEDVTSRKEVRGQIITDMAGRKVAVPAKIKKVYSILPSGSVFLYTLAPELLACWDYHLAPDEAKYILPKYRELPVMEIVPGANSAGCIEEIIKLDPDVILFMTNITFENKSLAYAMQRLMNIPVIVMTVL